jgi:hypothetical protein
MSIPSHLPQVIALARAATLPGLALQVGQQLEGKVLGLSANGATQVAIRGQTLALLLPVPALAGTIVQFEVLETGPQLRLGLLALPPAAQAGPSTGYPAQCPTHTTCSRCNGGWRGNECNPYRSN